MPDNYIINKLYFLDFDCEVSGSANVNIRIQSISDTNYGYDTNLEDYELNKVYSVEDLKSDGPVEYYSEFEHGII